MKQEKGTTMDFDVGNQDVLVAGAYFQKHQEAGDWQPMSTAPRDGTVIEVRCTYGVAPWYGTFRWSTKSFAHSSNGGIVEREGEPGWQGVSKLASSIDGGSSFMWRPYVGTDAYVDPTGGAQNSPAYWRGAVAAKYGLPLDHFEKRVAQNVAADVVQPGARPWWKRLLGDK